MPTLLRYLIFQIPGWAIAVAVALLLLEWEVVSFRFAALGVAGWVVKDLVSYPLLRSAYESHVKSGSEALVGRKGFAQGDLTPEGYIKVHGELWRAVANPGERNIASGTEVDILRAEGMKLFVRARRPDSNH